MELELNWERTKHYEQLLDAQICQEETQETIVPDAYPDILRIVEAGGQLCLTEKQVQDGRVGAVGMVEGWILYQPESGDALCKIDFSLPFAAKVDAPGCTSQSSCVVRPVLRRVDARTLNPRKVLVRADICLGVCLYEQRELSVCCSVECGTDVDVQQLTAERRAYLVTAVKEKAFSVYEEVHAPTGLNASGELLCVRADAWSTEAKLIGNKLIFKGEAGVRVRYLVGNQMCSTCIPISFSQIMEIEGAGEQETCGLDLYVTNLECARAGEDGHMLNITLDLIGQAVVSDQFPLVMLQDVYSTTGDLAVEAQNYAVTDLLEQYTKPQSMRELLETESQPKSVVDASVHVGCVSITGNSVETQLQADVMYVDDQDEVHSASRTIVASGQLDIPEGGKCQMVCSCPGEVFAAVTAGGIEMRFNLEFRGCITRQHAVVAVKNVRWTECGPQVQGRRPSVIMRTAMPGEKLWDIAKAYRTTTRDICQVNGIEQDSRISGRMLLIPTGC